MESDAARIRWATRAVTRNGCLWPISVRSRHHFPSIWSSGDSLLIQLSKLSPYLRLQRLVRRQVARRSQSARRSDGRSRSTLAGSPTRQSTLSQLEREPDSVEKLRRPGLCMPRTPHRARIRCLGRPRRKPRNGSLAASSSEPARIPPPTAPPWLKKAG